MQTCTMNKENQAEFSFMWRAVDTRVFSTRFMSGHFQRPMIGRAA